MEAKWMTKDWTGGDLNALVKNLGGEAISRMIQRGDFKPKFKFTGDALFDNYGRRIPKGLSAEVKDANWDYGFAQPNMRSDGPFVYRGARLLRTFHQVLDRRIGYSHKKFYEKTERLLTQIQDDPQIANILNGVWLPVAIPPLENDDIGTVLIDYLTALGKSYSEIFPDHKFEVRLGFEEDREKLANEVSIAAGSRYEQLIERMKQGIVYGILFPSALQGYSITACREQMASLREGFILSGLDSAIAEIVYPDNLASELIDCNPNLNLAALSWRRESNSLCFKRPESYRSDSVTFKQPPGKEFIFSFVSGLDRGHSDHTSGLLFIG
ncbi:MAG: hypothetical protein ABIC96_01680 [Patescibacteria group bacterium]